MPRKGWSVSSPESFWERVSKTPAGCWEWTGQIDHNGYGRLAGRLAHRVSWAIAGHPQPARGLHLDHLCRHRRCVNPDHLEIVTPAENTRRSGPATKDHCVNGHRMTQESTYIRARGGGRRQCRKCITDRVRRYKAGTCRYCDTPQTDVQRHIQRRHSTERTAA